MPRTQDQVAFSREVAAGRARQRPARVRTTVDIAAHHAGLSHDEAREQSVLRPEAEVLRARLGNIFEAAENGSSRGLGRIQASPPTVTRQLSTVECSNSPAWV